MYIYINMMIFYDTYMCMYISTPVKNQGLCGACWWVVYTYVRIHRYIYMCTYIHIYLYIYTNIHTYLWRIEGYAEHAGVLCIRMYTQSLFIYTYMYIYIYMYVYIYIYLYIYIYTYVNIYISTWWYLMTHMYILIWW
jgi:hypothetical protein